MGDLPDFTPYGYQILKPLGQNVQGGRETYCAIALDSQTTVILKEFRFLPGNTNWFDYQTWEREINILQQLDHPNIPHYLQSFETPHSICLVQEYKDATPLTSSHAFSLSEIQQITLKLLQILDYLTQQNPPLIHRDIKPANILIDEAMNVYLIDFGLAKPRGEMTTVQSMIVGTMGFMSPEQIQGKPLTPATDLYSLGVTIISLLTKTPASEISSLFNLTTNRLEFKDQLSSVNPALIRWLNKMVHPNPAKRFQDAKSAYQALSKIDVNSAMTETFFTPILTHFSQVKLSYGFGLILFTLSASIAWFIQLPLAFTPSLPDFYYYTNFIAFFGFVSSLFCVDFWFKLRKNQAEGMNVQTHTITTGLLLISLMILNLGVLQNTKIPFIAGILAYFIYRINLQEGISSELAKVTILLTSLLGLNFGIFAKFGLNLFGIWAFPNLL